jgi:predicted RNase H-like HicB family nuclease
VVVAARLAEGEGETVPLPESLLLSPVPVSLPLPELSEGSVSLLSPPLGGVVAEGEAVEVAVGLGEGEGVVVAARLAEGEGETVPLPESLLLSPVPVSLPPPELSVGSLSLLSPPLGGVVPEGDGVVVVARLTECEGVVEAARPAEGEGEAVPLPESLLSPVPVSLPLPELSVGSVSLLSPPLGGVVPEGEGVVVVARLAEGDGVVVVARLAEGEGEAVPLPESLLLSPVPVSLPPPELSVGSLSLLSPPLGGVVPEGEGVVVVARLAEGDGVVVVARLAEGEGEAVPLPESLLSPVPVSLPPPELSVGSLSLLSPPLGGVVPEGEGVVVVARLAEGEGEAVPLPESLVSPVPVSLPLPELSVGSLSLLSPPLGGVVAEGETVEVAVGLTEGDGVVVVARLAEGDGVVVVARLAEGEGEAVPLPESLLSPVPVSLPLPELSEGSVSLLSPPLGGVVPEGETVEVAVGLTEGVIDEVPVPVPVLKGVTVGVGAGVIVGEPVISAPPPLPEDAHEKESVEHPVKEVSCICLPSAASRLMPPSSSSSSSLSLLGARAASTSG